jgi:hypothetical protein
MTKAVLRSDGDGAEKANQQNGLICILKLSDPIAKARLFDKDAFLYD